MAQAILLNQYSQMDDKLTTNEMKLKPTDTAKTDTKHRHMRQVGAAGQQWERWESLQPTIVHRFTYHGILNVETDPTTEHLAGMFRVDVFMRWPYHDRHVVHKCPMWAHA